jgi:hypothetical protein
MSKLKPIVRRSDLKPIDPETLVGAEPPVNIPKDDGDKATLKWLEALRDHHEKGGELLTVPGMLAYADEVGLSDGDVKDLKKQIKKLYADEVSADEPQEPKPAAKSGKKESAKVTTATKKAAPTKAAAKNGKAATNGKGNPAKAVAKNGTGKAKGNAGKKAAPAKAASASKTVLDRDVNGVPVVVTESNGKYRVKVGDTTLRKVLQWMGYKGWTSGEARAAAAKLLKGFPKGGAYDGGEDYAANLIEEGHLGAHKSGTFDCPKKPELSKDVAKAVTSLKK